MPHGTPDYNITAGAKTTHQLTDLGELAVRLGSPDAFDRRGDVVWWDDFECGVSSWDASIDGTGAAVDIDTTHPRNGAQAVKLTAGSDGIGTAGINKAIAYPVLSRFGFEFSFGTLDLPLYVVLSVNLYDGARFTQAGFRWDRANDKLQYQDSGGNWVNAATYDVRMVAPFLYNTVKLVFDSATDEYVRLVFNERTIDLSGIPLLDNASAEPPYFNILIAAYGRAGSNDVAYADDFIVTQNEPP